MNTLIAPLIELKFDAGAPGRFKGYGSTFGNVDLGKDVCVKGCFKRALAEHVKGGSLPAMYWQHDRKEPIGDWLDVKEDDHGLQVEGQLWHGDDATECSKKAYNMLKGTGPKGMSIGYVTKVSQFDQKTGVRQLQDVDLPEVSIVGYGMNPKARVMAIKSMPSELELEQMLQDAGFSPEHAKALLAEGYKGLNRKVTVEPTMEQDIRQLLRLRAMLRGED
jgi:HK97 family phage prohead protease